jgi:hypothetical protein
MSGNLWTFLGALLIVGALGLVYSWKVEADRAAELEAQVHRLEQRIQADDAAMARRDKAREEAAKKAQEQRNEIQKGFDGLTDNELACRLHGILCAKGANQGDTHAAPGHSAGGMPEASAPGGND